MRRKAAGGKAKTKLSPRTPSCPYEVRKAAAYVWRLWLLRVALKFRFQRKQPIAKSPLVFFCELRGSRNAVWDTEKEVTRGHFFLHAYILMIIRPQLSHSTISSLALRTRCSTALGRDVLQPEHWPFTRRLSGGVMCFLMRL